MTLTVCEALARQEGWFYQGGPPTRCQRNRNPGNIRYGAFARSHNALGSDDGGFAVFPTAQDGFNAISSLLEAFYVGLTLAQAISKWAPPTENNTAQYIQDVALWTGLTAETVLTADLLAPPTVSS